MDSTTFIPPCLREVVAAETTPLPVICALSHQRVLDRLCLDGDRLTRRYVAFTPQQLLGLPFRARVLSPTARGLCRLLPAAVPRRRGGVPGHARLECSSPPVVLAHA